MCKIKAVMLVGLLLLSHVVYEGSKDESVSVKAAQDVNVNVPPVVEILPDVSSGKAPLTVHLGYTTTPTGLYYYGARYYDCDIGRFITKDPLTDRKANPQSLNRYTYCLNNPVRLVDPAGLEARMCNIDTGICIRDTANGWLATNENGDTLSLSEIQQKIDEKDYVGAISLILDFLGYEVTGQGTSTEPVGEDEIEVDYLFASKDGKTTQVRIYDTDAMEILAPGATRDDHPTGMAQPNTNFFIRAFVCIYFFSDVNMTAEELFHTVGHEMVHAEHYATGLFEEWKRRWNLSAAIYYSEYLAYRWNVLHLNIVNFPRAQERYEDWMRGYLRKFFKAIK